METVRKIGSFACAGLLTFSLGVPLAWGDQTEPREPGGEPPKAEQGALSDSAAPSENKAEEASGISGDSGSTVETTSVPASNGIRTEKLDGDADKDALAPNDAGFDPSAIPTATKEDTRDVWVHVAQDPDDASAVIVSAMLADEAPADWTEAVVVTKETGLANADPATPLGRNLHLVVDAVPSKASESNEESVSHAVELYFGTLDLSGKTMSLALNATLPEGEDPSLSFNAAGAGTVQIGRLEGFGGAGVMVGCSLVLGSGLAGTSEIGQLIVMDLAGMTDAIKDMIGGAGSTGGGGGLGDLGDLGGLGGLGGGDGSGGLGDLSSMFPGFSGSLANNGALNVGSAIFLGSPLVNNGSVVVSGACQAMMGGNIENSQNAHFVCEEGSQFQAQLAKISNSGTMRFSGNVAQLMYAPVVNNGDLQFAAQMQSFGSASSGDMTTMPEGFMTSIQNNGIMTVSGKTRFMKDAPVTNAAGADLTLEGAPLDVYSLHFANNGTLRNAGEMNLYGPLVNAGSFDNAGLITLKQNIDDETGALDSVGSIIDQGGTYGNGEGRGRVVSEVPVTDAERAILERLGALTAPAAEPVAAAKKLASTGDDTAPFVAGASAAAALVCATGAYLLSRRSTGHLQNTRR
ncbi:hypothetical protein [Gordonibacter sp. 28C]|uniref:hypothetical protein n=1 Tax=Gordonibacter sp. 28C TaxID=2078569 RepID=UPI0013142469|nr:hypothetical protein [Gordonibacter sp. 28C]